MIGEMQRCPLTAFQSREAPQHVGRQAVAISYRFDNDLHMRNDDQVRWRMGSGAGEWPAVRDVTSCWSCGHESRRVG